MHGRRQHRRALGAGWLVPTWAILITCDAGVVFGESGFGELQFEFC